ncbi:MAG: stage 0 sporulation family protein [Clostridia bacterium]|nr:stage 0 sporulation family protein [Clostridia bacterium]
MDKIIGARFFEVGKIHYFSCHYNISVGDMIIAETKRGIESGKVVYAENADKFKNLILPGEKILRKATEKDMKSLEEKKKEEEKARKICQKKIDEHKLEMKLINVEYIFDRSKVIFYFVSESRVDFRNLVKDLASTFKIRIELRQVGIRDEAKMVGGLAPCGRPLCCGKFLDDFQSVSIKMAKDQGVSLNPTKLSGTCGRLMCCLKYEQDFYHEAISTMPSVGSTVETPDGKGEVVSCNVISGYVKVLMDNEDKSIQPKNYNLSEIKFSR